MLPGRAYSVFCLILPIVKVLVRSPEQDKVRVWFRSVIFGRGCFEAER